MVLNFVARQSLQYQSLDLRVDFLFLTILDSLRTLAIYIALESRQCLRGVILCDVRAGNASQCLLPHEEANISTPTSCVSPSPLMPIPSG